MFLNCHLDNYDDKEDDTELCRIKDILLSEMYEKELHVPLNLIHKIKQIG